MKRIFLFIVCIVLALCFGYATGYGQAKASDPKEKPKVEASPIEVEPDLQRAIEAGQSDVEKAELALELAKTKLANTILQIRIVLKIPLEYRLRLRNGKLYFEQPDNK